MDPSEEHNMKHVGFFGIFKHSFKTILSRKKIFTKITLTLILPLTIIFLAHMEISNCFFGRIENNYIPYNSTYRNNTTITYWLYYWLFKIIYFTFLTLFSVLSTSTVVFTIASVYVDHDVIFLNLIVKVIPNVWKKLCITFMFIYIALFIYNVMCGVVIYIIRYIFGYSVLGSVVFLMVLIVYVLGFLYLSVVWELASVVSVLEDKNGFKAMRKGKGLANGKKKVGMGIGFVLYGILLGLIFVYEWFVEYGDEVSGLGMIWRVMIGVLCGILLMKLFLLFIVTQTVLYLVCTSYHGEAIDKPSLSGFLSTYTRVDTVEHQKQREIRLGIVQPQPPAQIV